MNARKDHLPPSKVIAFVVSNKARVVLENILEQLMLASPSREPKLQRNKCLSTSDVPDAADADTASQLMLLRQCRTGSNAQLLSARTGSPQVLLNITKPIVMSFPPETNWPVASTSSSTRRLTSWHSSRLLADQV